MKTLENLPYTLIVESGQRYTGNAFQSDLVTCRLGSEIEPILIGSYIDGDSVELFLIVQNGVPVLIETRDEIPALNTNKTEWLARSWEAFELPNHQGRLLTNSLKPPKR